MFVILKEEPTMDCCPQHAMCGKAMIGGDWSMGDRTAVGADNGSHSLLRKDFPPMFYLHSS
jgi:hypothetical protein